MLESLPGIESLTDYTFKYGRNPMLELPLAVNPTGCARYKEISWENADLGERGGGTNQPFK